MDQSEIAAESDVVNLAKPCLASCAKEHGIAFLAKVEAADQQHCGVRCRRGRRGGTLPGFEGQEPVFDLSRDAAWLVARCLCLLRFSFGSGEWRSGNETWTNWVV